jgi:plastocyanin
MRRCTIAACSAFAMLASLGLLTGCGDDAEGGGTATEEPTTTAAAKAIPDLAAIEFDDETGATEVAIVARDNAFLPQYIEIDPGTTVVFTNRGRVDHNVLPVVEGAFTPIEIEDLEPGEVASITFDEPGEYPYYCSLHGTTTRGMVGAIRVLGE